MFELKTTGKNSIGGFNFFTILCSTLFYILFVKIKVPAIFELGACYKVGRSYTHCATEIDTKFWRFYWTVTQCVKVAMLWHTVIKSRNHEMLLKLCISLNTYFKSYQEKLHLKVLFARHLKHGKPFFNYMLTWLFRTSCLYFYEVNIFELLMSNRQCISFL